MEYLSLYDFLGKKAGKELGKDVNKRARELNIPPQTREINNPVYSGPVHLYPMDFLVDYFTVTPTDQDYNLPF